MSQIQETPCPICGGQSYIWGNTQGYYALKFKPDDASFWAKMTVLGGSDVRSRMCNKCGNIQLFARDFGSE